jgi:hypothetical protein
MMLAFVCQFQKKFSGKSMHQCEAENGRRRILHDRGKTHHKAPFLYGAAARQAVRQTRPASAVLSDFFQFGDTQIQQLHTEFTKMIWARA